MGWLEITITTTAVVNNTRHHPCIKDQEKARKKEEKEYSYKVYVYICPSSGPLKKDESENSKFLVEIVTLC